MLAILAVVGFSTIAAADWDGGSGHMMGPMMGSGWNHGNGYYGDLTAEQISKLDQRRLEFFKATEGLRRQLYEKEVVLQAELTKENPDNGKAAQLQSEVSKLRSERWPSSFGQLLLFFKWSLCLLLGCLFNRRQHHGVCFVRGPFL